MAESADAKALKATLSLVEKQFGKGAIMTLGESHGVSPIEGILFSPKLVVVTRPSSINMPSMRA